MESSTSAKVRPRSEENENARSSLGVQLGVYAERHVFDSFPQEYRTKIRWTTSTGHGYKAPEGGLMQENMLTCYEPQRSKKTYRGSSAPGLTRLSLESYVSYAVRPNLDFESNHEMREMTRPKCKASAPAPVMSDSSYRVTFHNHKDRAKQALQENQKPPRSENLNIFAPFLAETRPWSQSVHEYMPASPASAKRPQDMILNYSRHAPGALASTYMREHSHSAPSSPNGRSRSSKMKGRSGTLRRPTTASLPGLPGSGSG